MKFTHPFLSLILSIYFCLGFCTNGILAQTRQMAGPVGPGNSVLLVVVRDLQHADGTHYFRVESTTARITPQTLTARTPDREFTRADKNFMKKYLNARAEDEAGHLVAATLGGTRARSNLSPQHRTLNRNHNEQQNPHTLNSWFTEENKIRNYLQTHPQGRVDWIVTANYDTLTTGRPSSFTFSSTYWDNNVRVRSRDTFGSIRNQAPKNGM